MDFITGIIGLFVILLIIVPFMYFHFAQKARKKKFTNEFLDMAAKQGVVVTQYDVWSCYFAIGLDSRSNKLFYYRKRNNKEEQALVNLAEVDKCWVNHVKVALNEDQVIGRLELVLHYRNGKSGEKALLFYSKEEFMTHFDELQLVEKWRGIVSPLLDSKKNLSLAS